MSLERIEIFCEWLDDEEEKRGWNDNKLSIAAGLSSSVLNKARNQGILPKWDACVAIANALNISPITVFRKAGLLQDRQPEDEVAFEDWKVIIGQMSPDDEQEMRETALLRIERRKKDQNKAHASNMKPRVSEK